MNTTAHDVQAQPAAPARRRIVIGVGGGIAAYKTALLVRLFTESGDDVTVVPTEAALKFVGAPTWSALSGKPVTADVFDGVEQVRHVKLGQTADLVVVAPATANLLAKAAHGLADDLLTNVLLTAHCPVVLAPAMHTEMWQHPATVTNVATLRERGVHVIEPADGRLTGKDSGPGRLPEPEQIHQHCLDVLAGTQAAHPRPEATTTDTGDLSGQRVLITTGGTREALDPVRYLGNRSSGKQGIALAVAAAEHGAEVDLVAAAVDVPLPRHERICIHRVESAREMLSAVTTLAEASDVVIMVAAVADFRPADVAASKIKKMDDDGAPTITLVRNPDILRGLVEARQATGANSPLIVGFAAETGDAEHSVLDFGRQKLARKGCDLLVVNQVGVGVTFGQDVNTVTILRRDGGQPIAHGPADKRAIAEVILDSIRDAM